MNCLNSLVEETLGFADLNYERRLLAISFIWSGVFFFAVSSSLSSSSRIRSSTSISLTAMVINLASYSASYPSIELADTGAGADVGAVDESAAASWASFCFCYGVTGLEFAVVELPAAPPPPSMSILCSLLSLSLLSFVLPLTFDVSFT